MKTEESGFMTCMLRSYNETLSKDIYAKLWKTKNRDALTKQYLNAISLEETNAHCLRNRYFLETIKTLVKKNKIEVLINFGSGFSMYPFLMEQAIINIEIDKPEIVNFKKFQVKQWQKEKKLPKREIHFIGVDFSDDYEQELKPKLLSIINNKSALILIEGVLFFLKTEECNKLFNFFRSIQSTYDFIGSVSFNDSVKETIAFQKLLDFMNNKGLGVSASDCLSLEDHFYEKLKAYKLIDKQDYYSLSKKYNNTIKLSEEFTLNEVFYLLQKI